MRKAKLIEVMGDREFWSLLEGYGPNDRDRPDRHMSDEERGAYLLEIIKDSASEIRPTSDIRLVIQVKERS